MQPLSRSFTVAACLGRGGFGEVYRARMLRSEGLETEVALKVLRRDIDPDGQAMQRLRDEGRLLSKLNHPAILKVHDLIVLEGRIALVTEYVDGDDLSDCMRGDHAIGTRALLQVIAVLAGALHAAWMAPGPQGPLHMVHRDLKPSNVRLSRHGDVKLLDFGIARSDAESVEREARTRTGMMVGSPAYMAPERFMERAIHLESDVFSLCAILYEGVTGERYYGDLPIPLQVGLAVDDERYQKHLAARLQVVEQGSLRDLLERGLAYKTQDRPGPDALARELDELAEALPGASLTNFVRERSWSDVLAIDGELMGRTLTETLAGPVPPPPAETLLLAQAPVQQPVVEKTAERRPGLGRWVLLLSIGGVGAVVLVLLLVGGLIAIPYALTAQSAPTPSPSEPTLPAPVASPNPLLPAPPVVLPPKPIPPPRPVRATAPRLKPSPHQVVPSPHPAPAPDPAPLPVAPTATVRLQGGLSARLIGNGAVHQLPGNVPAGAYRLHVLFNGLDPIDVRALTLVEGTIVTIDCSARFTRCTVK